jgi:hypothetical protein
MANILALDGNGDLQEFAPASGDGSNGSPFVTLHAAAQYGTWNVGTVTTITNVVHVDDNSGSLTVDDGGSSLTVDGTVAATQSGTWTVQPGNTANTTAWLVTGTGGTFPATQSGTWNITNITGTITLPSGAATSAKQPGLGTAGTAAADVITIQGIASMTPVLVTASIASAQTLATVTTVGTVTTITNVVHVDDNSGSLTVDDGGGSLTVDGTVAATQSGTWNVGTVTTVSAVTSLTQFNGNAIDTNSGSKSAGTLRVVLATDQPTMSNPQPVSQNGTWNVGTVTTVTTVSAVTSLSQFAGNAIDTNSGSKSAGTLRVVLATDQPTMSNPQPVSLASLPALAAGTALIGKVAAELATDTILSGTTALTPKFAKITASSSGDNQILAGVSSKKIRVLNYLITASGAVNVKWRSATTSDISGLLYPAANGGAGASFSPVGHFETVAGEDLTLNLSGAVAVGGHLTYLEV